MPASRILIVEDERLVANALSRNLEGLGYQVVSAVASGEDALKKAEETRPDLVLMDIRLEGEMDGIQAAGLITARFNIPIIFVTAYADRNVLAKAKVTGPYGYLIKPISKRELHSALEIALYKHQMGKKLRESEEKHRELAEFLPQFIFEIDLNGKLTFANRSGLDAAGYTADDMAGGMQASELIAPEDRDRMTLDMRRVLEGETVGAHYTILRKKGSTFPTLTHAAPIRRDGAIAGIRGVSVDITELKRLQHELKSSNELLEMRVAERTAELAASNEELRREVSGRGRTPTQRGTVSQYLRDRDGLHVHQESQFGIHGCEPRYGDSCGSSGFKNLRRDRHGAFRENGGIPRQGSGKPGVERGTHRERTYD